VSENGLAAKLFVMHFH